jgi:hypothetical protein
LCDTECTKINPGANTGFSGANTGFSGANTGFSGANTGFSGARQINRLFLALFTAEMSLKKDDI